MSARSKRRWRKFRYPKPLIEALMTHEAFRRLGFASDYIFFQVNQLTEPGLKPLIRHHDGSVESVLITPDMQWQITVHLILPDEKSFVVTVGVLGREFTHAQIQKLWLELIADVKSDRVDEQAAQRMWERSDVRMHVAELVRGLVLKGMLTDRAASP